MGPLGGDRKPIGTGPLYSLFDFLNADEPPGRSDCIFVFAGRPERKRYGIEMWKRGLAPTLILSVGRFEWRKFPELGLPDDGGLAMLVQETPPPQRHFFVVIDSNAAKAIPIDVRGLGTWREARALAKYLRSERCRSVQVVSTSIHLRRAGTVLRSLLRDSGISVRVSAIPEAKSDIRRVGWWRTPRERAAVSLEALKFALYWLRLRLP